MWLVWTKNEFVFQIIDMNFLYVWVEMTNKLVLVGIARIRLRFDGKFPHWLGMGMGMDMSMGMGNPRLLQLGMGMVMGMYIFPP